MQSATVSTRTGPSTDERPWERISDVRDHAGAVFSSVSCAVPARGRAGSARGSSERERRATAATVGGRRRAGRSDLAHGARHAAPASSGLAATVGCRPLRAPCRPVGCCRTLQLWQTCCAEMFRSSNITRQSRSILDKFRGGTLTAEPAACRLPVRVAPSRFLSWIPRAPPTWRWESREPTPSRRTSCAATRMNPPRISRSGCSGASNGSSAHVACARCGTW